jgi:hypothetical protein
MALETTYIQDKLVSKIWKKCFNFESRKEIFFHA